MFINIKKKFQCFFFSSLHHHLFLIQIHGDNVSLFHISVLYDRACIYRQLRLNFFTLTIIIPHRKRAAATHIDE